MSKPVCYLSLNTAPGNDSPDHHDIAVFSEDVSVSALAHESLDESTKQWADTLNQKLQGRVVVADSQADVDQVNSLFVRSGVTPAFTLEVISEGWVQDMIDSYETFKAAFLAKQTDTRALTLARAMQYGHSKMIPF